MKEEHKQRLLNGIIVMSQPGPLFIAIACLLLLGWIAFRDLPLLLVIIAVAYSILALAGGQLAKSVMKESPRTPR